MLLICQPCASAQARAAGVAFEMTTSCWTTIALPMPSGMAMITTAAMTATSDPLVRRPILTRFLMAAERTP